MEEILYQKISIQRPDALKQPIDIYNFIWNTFCVQQQKDMPNPIEPLLFIIMPDTIDIVNFKNFIKHNLYAYFIGDVIKKKLKNNESIEAVAMCFESLVIEHALGKNCRFGAGLNKLCMKKNDIIILSLEWKNIPGIFLRSAQKLKVREKYKLVDLENTDQASLFVEKFFDTNKLERVLH